jgi:hypothetical protein
MTRDRAAHVTESDEADGDHVYSLIVATAKFIGERRFDCQSGFAPVNKSFAELRKFFGTRLALAALIIN